MADGLYDREDDILWHLRNNLTDPSTRGTDGTDIFSGTGSQTEFILTNTGVKNIKVVRVGGTPINYGYNYSVVLGEGAGTSKVVISTPPPFGVDNVEVDYHHGQSFVYQEVAREDASLPRCVLMHVTSNHRFSGLGETHEGGKKAGWLMSVHRFEAKGRFAGQVKSIINEAWNLINAMRHVSPPFYKLEIVESADLTNFDFDPDLKVYTQQFTIRSQWEHIFKD